MAVAGLIVSLVALAIMPDSQPPPAPIALLLPLLAPWLWILPTIGVVFSALGLAHDTRKPHRLAGIVGIILAVTGLMMFSFRTENGLATPSRVPDAPSPAEPSDTPSPAGSPRFILFTESRQPSAGPPASAGS